MPTKDGFNLDHPLPLFLADDPEQQGIGKAWDRAVILSRVPPGEYFGCNGDSDRFRNSIGGKSRDALCGRHGFAGRQIGASAWHRSIDANNSIYRRCSGFAADRK